MQRQITTAEVQNVDDPSVMFKPQQGKCTN